VLNRLSLVLVVGAMAIGLVAAGCGSSDDSSSDSAASLTKAEFIKEGNAICTKGNAEIESGYESFSKENDLSETKAPSEAVQEEAAEEILIPAITTQLEELRALGTPEGDEGEVDEILTGAEEAVEEGEEDPATLIGSDAGGFTEVNKQARAYGLTVCGEEG
jgi:hypothetical protein